MNRLTAREREVIQHVLKGAQNKHIAHVLGIAESTVKVHLKNAMRKIGVRNRTSLALVSLEMLDVAS